MRIDRFSSFPNQLNQVLQGACQRGAQLNGPVAGKYIYTVSMMLACITTMNRRKFLAGSLTTGSGIALAGCGSIGGNGGNGGNGDVSEEASPEEDTEYEELRTLEFISESRSDNPFRFEIAEQAATQLQALGFDIERSVHERGTWADRLFKRDWDFNSLWWDGSIERIYPYYMLFFSFHSQFAREDAGNFPLWESEEYDRCVERFAESMDEDEAAMWAKRCQEIISLNVPLAFTEHPNSLVAASNENFTNWNEMIGNFAYWNINTLRDVEADGEQENMVYGSVREPGTYPNYYNITGTFGLMIHKMTYDTVVELDYEGQPYPRAGDWEVIDDTTIDVTLKENTWHDGEPVTAEDVKFTWDTAQEYGIPWMESSIEAYEDSEIMSDQEIRINLSYPFAAFPDVGLFRMCITPKHVWEPIVDEYDHPSEWPDPDMTGSGPFEFVDFEPGTHIILDKNPDHYYADEIPFDRLVYNLYGSNAAVVGDLESGDIDFAQFLGPADFSQAQTADSVEAVANPNIQTNGIWMVTDREPFNDVWVRRAVNHAIDQEDTVEVVYDGYAEPAKGTPIAPANEFWHYEDAEYYGGNLEQAREYLMDSGFRWDDDGTILKPVDWEPHTEYVSPEGSDDWF